MDAISEALIKKYPDRKGLIEQSAKEAQFMDMLNGRFRDSGRVADSPGEYLDSVVGAPARTGIDEMQKGHFDLDALKKMLASVGSDPKNAPTGVDLAYNTGIRNPYLGAAAATAFDLGAQVPVGEIASLGKAGVMGKISDVSPEAILSKYNTAEKATALKGPERAQYLEALDQMHGPRDQRARDMGFGDKTWYHGSFADIEKMKPAEQGNFLGQSVYATSNPLDASHNYAETTGPDFDIKVDRMVSELQDKNPEMGSGKAYKTVMQQLTGGRESGAVYPLKIKAENPINLNRLGNDGWVNTRDAANKLRRESGKPELSYRSDLPGEALRQALEEKGHDAAFVKPDEQWPGFPYVEHGDQHVMLQNPNQVRSVNAAFDPRFKDSSNLLAAILGANPMQPGAGLLRARSQKDNN